MSSDQDINCFSLVDENKWGLVVSLNLTTATVTVAGAGPQVLTCINRQQNLVYQVSVSGDETSRQYLDPFLHSWQGEAGQLDTAPPVFTYLVYGGRYRLGFSRCGAKQGECGDQVYSDYVNLQSHVFPWCSANSFPGNSTVLQIDSPTVEGMSAVFQFSYSPCSPVVDYDVANVTLFSSDEKDQCGSESGRVIYKEVVPVLEVEEGIAAVSYRSPQVKGDQYYCVSVHLSHISCRLPSVDSSPNCHLHSSSVFVPALPAIAKLLPMCTSHLACGWLYIAVIGGVALITALLLAVICVRCCERRSRSKQNDKPVDEVDFGISEDFCLTSLPGTRQTWVEVHDQWERGGVVRGKLLLLYSPDTKLFRELQEALKSFLDMACHCDVYDLFDDALFDTIALDPSEWMEQLLADRNVKIIVISSIGAHRRQLALRGEMPLNLPENSLLDGLFTSGLRYLTVFGSNRLTDRLATLRYEMLHLTEAGHKLDPPVAGAPEFLVPTQLHQLFCWVHGLQPLELMGKPWDNYHLEMQLLQDALKLVRRDRTAFIGCNNGVGNGYTMI